jgi:urea carboxylase
LRPGDVLPLGEVKAPAPTKILPVESRPAYSNDWEIGVLYGPHGAPDFFTPGDIATFFEASWEVHYNSSRTGVRLIGPKPQWARKDGGEAGLHPSNIHDNAYAIGAIDFTGDMPVILGPDGPSLGGFVCPAVIVEAELWKIGQLRPGDRIRFIPVAFEEARERSNTLDVANLPLQSAEVITAQDRSLILGGRPEAADFPQVVYRQAGDNYLLVEYGPVVLDLNLRLRVHRLMLWLEEKRTEGIVDLTPGIRSLQVHFDPEVLPREALLELLTQAEGELLDENDVEVPTRIVYLPLSWDDPATRLAIQKYMQSVRADAPWCPSNIEFIRRINGLDSIEDVKEIVFGASYLVLGLGDVYLGAPVATPIDPRHRLVTTKYNPARTWTPENAVGIGGAYMCIYGMEGPGGYQFVGRTLPVWNTYRSTADFEPGKPWLLRFFDQIRFYPVNAAELLEMRTDFRAGRFQLRIEEETFSLCAYNQFLADNAASIGEFKTRQQDAFEAERERWRVDGQSEYISEADASPPESEELEVPPGAQPLTAPTSGVIWKVDVEEGASVKEGEVLVILEAMKTEFAVVAPCDGTLIRLASTPGQQVTAGQSLAVLQPS